MNAEKIKIIVSERFLCGFYDINVIHKLPAEKINLQKISRLGNFYELNPLTRSRLLPALLLWSSIRRTRTRPLALQLRTRTGMCHSRKPLAPCTLDMSKPLE